jgi:hypothetical protein
LRKGKLTIRGVDRHNRPLLVWDNSLHDPSTSNSEQVTLVLRGDRA